MTITLDARLADAEARTAQLKALLSELGSALWEAEYRQRHNMRVSSRYIDRLREDVRDAEFQLMLARTDSSLIGDAIARQGTQ